MDYKDLTAILLKIAGAVLIFWNLRWLPDLVLLAAQRPLSDPHFIASALTDLFGLGFGALLLVFPASVANKLVRGEPLSQDAALARALQVGAIRLIGLYHLMTGTVDLVHHFAKGLLTPTLYENMGLRPPPSAWTPDLVGWIIATVIELLIAAVFVLGAEQLYALLQKLRGRAAA